MDNRKKAVIKLFTFRAYTVATFFCAAFLLIGMITNLYYAIAYDKTQAVMTDVTVTTYGSYNDDTTPSHKSEFSYSYSYDGTVYEGTGSSSGIYEVGKQITIYVNPKAPYESKEAFGTILMIALVCITLFLVALWLVVRSFVFSKTMDGTGGI